MVIRTLKSSLRHHVITIFSTLAIAGFTIYYISGLDCPQSVTDHNRGLSSKDSKMISRNLIEMEPEDIVPKSVMSRIILPKTDEGNENSHKEKIAIEGLDSVSTHSAQRPRVATEVPKLTTQKWSKEWPRVNIQDCNHKEFMNKGINSPDVIPNRPYARTGIVSFPGSGNTWSRHLLQQATGIWTGSVYRDKSLYRGGFLGEFEHCRDNTTVAVKSHYQRLNNEINYQFDRIILVVRDPFRAILSEFNWRTTSQHTGIADPSLYKTNVWNEHVVARSSKWFKSTKQWMELFKENDTEPAAGKNAFTYPPDFSKKLLVVSYERLKKNTLTEMERIVEFLGLPTFRRKCVMDDVDGNFHRASKPSESIACLYEHDNLKETVLGRIKELVDWMQEVGLGNIVQDFEGIEGDQTSEKC